MLLATLSKALGNRAITLFITADDDLISLPPSFGAAEDS